MKTQEGEEGRAGGEAERIVVETGTAAGRTPALQEKTGENKVTGRRRGEEEHVGPREEEPSG
ncbi:hypothetical protein EYF80_045660 [Liparis tanakae]|uniref:Uncharacterized protein n=1 Tax=Liparis tanakae TaxID=230148 RepID=A0A4Z2FT02_9TELE|nr:hypothetical protein EYF80_045660 [Liparis tanakae]